MEWQPIDTAPKETIVLVYGYWDGELNEGDKVPDVWRAKFEFDLWWIDGGEYYSQYVRNPTHWMPLPNPPVLMEGK